MRRFLPLLFLAILPLARAAKTPAPVVVLPLEPLGYTAPVTHFASPRAVNYTVNFVDPTHLLFTFNSHGLIPRTPADREEGDNDRNVTALLLELPSGKILARTVWHVHDLSPYLWPLQNGRFLLRVRTRLEVLDPLRRLPEGDAFKAQSLVDLKRRFGFLSLSPDGDLLAVETIPKLKAKLVVDPDVIPKTPAQADKATAKAAEDEEDVDRRVPVRIHFYRLHENPTDSGKSPHGLYAQNAGILYTNSLISLPVTAEGFLDVAKEAANAYGFDFHSHAGAKAELSGYNSSCTPHPYFVSRSEFVAFGCRGGSDRNQISFFNLRGEQPWVGDFREAYVSPVILPAPAAGRFAISRTFLLNSLVENDDLSFENLTTQDITVYQNFDGRTLLKLQVTPIQMVGQNFDLSPTGLAFAIVRNAALEVYLLPPVTAQDQAEIKRALAAVPPANDVEISLGATKVTRKSEAVAEGVHKGDEILKPASDDSASSPSAAASATTPAAETPGTDVSSGSSKATAPTSSVAATPIDTAGSQPQSAPESNPNLVGDVPVQRTKPPSLFDPEHPKPKE